MGLFSINLGEGTPVSGTISMIDWKNGAKHLQVEFDPAGGSNYADMGTTQLMSVPYALHAGSSDNEKWVQNGADISNTNTGNVGIGTTTPQANLHVNDVAGLQNEASASMLLSRVWVDNTNTRASSVFHYYNGDTYNDNLAFSVSGDGGSQASPKSLNQIKMMIQANGKIGMGTRTPPSKLSIVDSGSQNAIHMDVEGGDALLQLSSTSVNHWTRIGTTGSPLAFVTQGNDKYGGSPSMFITNDGKIGIGTSTPNSTLNVMGNMHINHSGYGIVQENGTISMGTYIDPTAGWLGTNSNHPLYFYTNNGWESMVITPSGNIGMGTNTPNEKLAVAGSTGLYGNTVISPSMNGSQGTLSVGTSTIFPNSMLNVKSSLQYGAFIDGPNTSTAALQVEGRTKLNGNVAIGNGTGFSSNYRLVVDGKVACTELRVQALPFPDYVFDPAYELKPLEEVEEHIKNHHRLPNMPPATEVESEGMNVGGIQLKLVEKVEELTLYLLQQQKQLKEQQAEITRLNEVLKNIKK
ncbi:MAG: hypothetical protein IPN26_11180 [Bacteroidetes bacterium]|nr:hypothetical protein [Bacteroidota bacterium]